VTQIGTRTQIEDPPQLITGEMATATESLNFSDLRAKAFGHLRLLWERRRYLGKALFAGLVTGCLVAFLIPARYESSAQLMPPDNQSGSGLAMLAALTAKSGGGGGGLGAVAGDLLGVKSSGALFVGVLNSRTVEDRLIERFQLKKVYSVQLEEDARKNLAENTSVSEDRKTGIIAITVTDREPKRSAAIAQAYVEELNQLVAELSTSAAHRERVFLEERLSAVKQDLDDASQKFSQFASKNTAIDIKEQGRAMVEAASVLQGQLVAAESELKGLEQIYTSNNVRVRAVQARISELQRQLEKLGGKGFGDAGQETDSSYRLYPSIRELPLLGVTWADLYRRTRIQEIVYETLTQQYELAKVQEAKETPSVKVLDAARLPERKSFPPRLLIASFMGVLFLGTTVFGISLRKQWDETNDTDPEKLFAREVLQTVNGHMPWATPNGSRVQAITHRVWVRLVRSEDSVKKSDSSSN
jgi:capsule polysaccharide export protein KpsE/RkpR